MQAKTILLNLLIIFFTQIGNVYAEHNLILITVDTLRADHLGIYGYRRNTSPNIDHFAKKSIVFDNHITPRPKTLPSLVSLFTGLYPNQHGSRDNYQPISNVSKLLTSSFKQNGYHTIAVVSNIVLKPEYSGLDKDFDLYDIDLDEVEINRKNIKQRNAENTFKAAIKILNTVKDQKFFIWIHLIDPHGPYLPAQNYQNYFKSNEIKLVNLNLLPAYQILPNAHVNNNLTNINYYIDSYDDEIKYTDVQFGRFIADLEALELTKNSLIIFSSDHGESLDNHQYYLEHGKELYDNSIRIPLFIKTPDANPIPHMRYYKETSNVDLFPTILTYFNFDFPNQSSGLNLLELVTDRNEKDRIVFSENYMPPFSLKISAKSKNKKIIKFDQQKKCFDLLIDPGEINPKLCLENEYNILESAVNDYLETSNIIFPQVVHKDVNDIEALRSLGYIR